MVANKTQVTQSIGVTGLSLWNGMVSEEYLPALKGTKAYKIYKEMADYTIISTLLDCVKVPLLAAEITVVPASEDLKDKANAEFVEDCMFNMHRYTWRQHIKDCLSMLQYGWHVSEIVLYKRDDGKLAIDCLDPRDQNTLYKWIQDDHGWIEGMKQRDPVTGAIYEIPLWKMVHMTFNQENRNPEGKSLLRSLYYPYYMRKNLEVFEGMGIEKDAGGLPVLKLPYGADENSFEKAKTFIKNLRNDEEAGVVLPPPPTAEPNAQAWELSLLSAATKAYDVEAAIQRYGKEILMRFFAQFLALGMDNVGTQSLVKGSHDFFSLALKSIQQEMLETWNNQLVPLLIVVNGMESKNGYPLIDWADPGKADLSALGTFLKDMVSAKVITADDSIEEMLRDIAGLPEMTEQDIDRSPTPPPMAPMPEDAATEETFSLIRGIDGRNQPSGGRNAAISLTNGYQRELIQTVDNFGKRLQESIKDIANPSKLAVEQLLDQKLPILQQELIDLSEYRIRQGWALGQGRGNIPTLASKEALQQRLDKNRMYLATSFIPDLRDKILEEFVKESANG